MYRQYIYFLLLGDKESIIPKKLIDSSTCYLYLGGCFEVFFIIKINNIMRALFLFLGFLLVNATVSASTSAPFSPPTQEAIASTHQQLNTKKGKRLYAKLTQLIIKKLEKRAKRKAKKEGKAKPMATFLDVVALAGAIVCVVGIISIISAFIPGIVTALIGFLIYLLATNAGGSIGGVFS